MTQNSAKINRQTNILGGDLSGTITTSTVTDIQGTAVKTGVPADGYLLTYVTADGEWEPESFSFSVSNQYAAGPLVFNMTTVNGSNSGNTYYTLQPTDSMLRLVNPSGGGPSYITITLPATTVGRVIYITSYLTDPPTTPADPQKFAILANPGFIINATATNSATCIGNNGPGGVQMVGGMFVCYDGTNWAASNIFGC